MKMQKMSFKMLLALSAVILSTTLGSVPTFAQGRDGGGGNSYRGAMIEQYRTRNPGKLAGADQFLATLTRLDKTAPFFAKTLRETFYDLAWYVVPAPLPTLPQYKTGLVFYSDQTAFQARREVFVDSNKLPKTKEGRATLWLHETLMAEVLRTKGNASAADHARVRQMVVAIQENHSAEDMNAYIRNLGFISSATADVWQYQLIVQNASLDKYTPNGAILARKGSRFFAQVCAASALTEVRASQRDYNQPIFPGIQRAIARASKSSGCRLVDSNIYTLPQDVLNQISSKIKNRREDISLKVAAITGVATVVIPGAVCGYLANRYGGEVAFATTVCGGLYGLLASIVTAPVAYGLTDTLLKSSRFYGNKLTALDYANASFGNHSIMMIDENPHMIAAQMARGFQEMNKKGYVDAIPVRALR